MWWNSDTFQLPRHEAHGTNGSLWCAEKYYSFYVKIWGSVCVCFHFASSHFFFHESSAIVIYFRSHIELMRSPRSQWNLCNTTFIYETFFFMFLLKRNMMIKWNYLLHQFSEMLWNFTRICFQQFSSHRIKYHFASNIKKRGALFDRRSRVEKLPKNLPNFNLPSFYEKTKKCIIFLHVEDIMDSRPSR